MVRRIKCICIKFCHGPKEHGGQAHAHSAQVEGPILVADTCSSVDLMYAIAINHG